MFVESGQITGDTAFSFAARNGVWVQGSPVVSDSAPTTLASVAAGRRIVCRYASGILASTAPTVRIFSVGGTSVSVQPFYYDATLAVWIPINAAATVTSGALPATLNALNPLCGALLYVQIITVTGAVSAVGYICG